MKDHLPLDYYGCVEDMLLKVDDDVDMHCHVPTCQRVFHAWDRPGNNVLYDVKLSCGESPPPSRLGRLKRLYGPK